MTSRVRDLPAAERSAWWLALGAIFAGGLSGALIARERRSAARERRSAASELLAATRERRAVARALQRERRRVAAEVHDLVMQDLSLALANARSLSDDPAETTRAGLVVSAGERALAGARVVVGDLTEQSEPDSEPIARAVEASVQAAARGAQLRFDAGGVPRSARPDRLTREALVHIAREAVTNASKHAETNAIEVSLQYDGSWRLRVRDEGAGFDSTRTGNGFGLRSMRAHVQALGGSLHVRSAAEGGTTVEAVLP
jgi:signal transduction histidine kinase